MQVLNDNKPKLDFDFKYVLLAAAIAIVGTVIFFSVTNLYSCKEKHSQETYALFEGCGNGICDLNEFKNHQCPTDCMKQNSCIVMDANSVTGKELVSFNDKNEWVNSVIDYCNIDTNNVFSTGVIVSWVDENSYYSFNQDNNSVCERVFK